MRSNCRSDFTTLTRCQRHIPENSLPNRLSRWIGRSGTPHQLSLASLSLVFLRRKIFLPSLALAGLLASMAVAEIVAIPRTIPGGGPYYTGQVFLYSLTAGESLVTLPAIPETFTNNPSYSAFNEKGELFVANRHGTLSGGIGSISRFLVDENGNFVPNGIIEGNGLENVHGVTFSAQGELFASNYQSGTISRFVFDNKDNATPNGTFPMYGIPQGLAFNHKGELFINDVANTVVKRFLFDPATGDAIPNGEFAVPDASGLHGLAFSATGELFVASLDTDTIFRFTFDGNGTSNANGSFAVSGGPLGVAFSAAGELFVTGHLSGGINRFTFDNGGNAVLKEFIPTDFLGGISIGAVETNMIPVTISINPGSTTNYIDTSADGEIAVAILSTTGGNSTEEFDALTIDPFSLRLGPYQSPATNSPGLIEDVNYDGLPDLVLYFNTQDTGILCRDTSVLITGKTLDGTSIIMGTQAIQTEGCNPVVIRVNVLTDEIDDRCPTSCSIRAALARANPGDEIQFDVVGWIGLTQGNLVVDKDLTITGPGAESLALDGNSASRVMVVNSGVTATIAGLTIQNGYFGWEGGDEDRSSSGISNFGTLTLTDCNLSGNSGGGFGGGISNLDTGTLVMTNCTVGNNSSVWLGGGIYNEGALTLINSTISGNYSSNGGGIFNGIDETLTLTNSTISGNHANDGYGGGIYNDTGGSVTISNSTLSANFSTYGGGGIVNSGSLTCTSCTLSDNSNSLDDGNSIYNAEGTVTIARSVIAHRSAGTNCLGEITSQGDNLSTDSTCITTNRTLNDRNNTDPLLDPAGLQDHGGPTPTIALLPESPAVDSVLYNACPPPTSDQRGVPRPAGERCDIGAIEQTSMIAAVFDISPYNDTNTIDLGVNGAITVAILSAPANNVSDPFNALDIDPLTVRLGPKGGEVISSQGLIEDVNHDGLPDLVLQFSSPNTGIRCGDDAVQMTGRTYVGIEFEGTDVIQTVECKQITVNVLTDQAEDSCPETCSIRAALYSANAGDEIQFDVSGTITLTQGELVVHSDLIIKGPGQERLAIDANFASRVLVVNSWVTASIQGLTIKNGDSENESEGPGGGIYNEGTLTLSDSTLSGNSVNTDESFGSGGGILNMMGTLTVTNSTLRGNSAGFGGGICNNNGTVTLINSTLSDNWSFHGGGIDNTGTLTLTNSTLNGNHAEYYGGGVYSGWGTLTVTNSTLSGNTASEGGGIFNQDTLTLTNTTFSANRADAGNGGGVYSWGTLTVTNSTFSANRADAGNGGGVYTGQSIVGPGQTMTHTTFSANSASQGGGIYTEGASSVDLGSSIVTGSPSGGNCSGTVYSLGNNISSDDTCPLYDPSDRNNTDPLLDPAGLQDNGGPTLTISLQVQSPALDGVRLDACPPPDTDQRGFPRPAGASCDIGAVEKGVTPVTLSINPDSGENYVDTSAEGEITVVILSTAAGGSSDYFDALTVDPLSIHFGPYRAPVANPTGVIEDINNDGLPDLSLSFNTQDTGILCRDTSAFLTGGTFDGGVIQATVPIQTQGCTPVVITVNVLSDEPDDRCPRTCSLRAALARANAGDEIQFTVNGEIQLQGELVVDKDLTITGPGAENLALNGGWGRVMSMTSGVTASIQGLTLQNGVASQGGGIFNEGTLTLTNSTVRNNREDEMGGGGIVNNGTLTLVNSNVSGNRTGWNAAAGILNRGVMTLINSTISDNISEWGRGGGILNSGTLTVTNSTISDNLSSEDGGGIFNWGTVTLTNSTLEGNWGGGITNDGGTVTIARSIIANSSNGGNCSGEIISQGDNLSSDNTCITTNRTLNDRNNTDPLLDPAGLQDNGGPTLTIALQPGSPALDGVRHGTCPPPDTDQRGVARPSGARCDIGAVESGTRFASFSPQTELEFGPREADDSFQGTARFEVNSESNGIDPLYEDVTLTLGTLSIKVPAGSFTSSRRDDGTERIWFRGFIEGVRLTVVLYPQGSNHYKVWVKGKGAKLDGVTMPPAISLAIGDDSGRSIMNSGRAKFRTSRGVGGQ